MRGGQHAAVIDPEGVGQRLVLPGAEFAAVEVKRAAADGARAVAIGNQHAVVHKRASGIVVEPAELERAGADLGHAAVANNIPEKLNVFERAKNSWPPSIDVALYRPGRAAVPDGKRGAGFDKRAECGVDVPVSTAEPMIRRLRSPPSVPAKFAPSSSHGRRRHSWS